MESDRFLVTYPGTALSRNASTGCLHETQSEYRSTLSGSLLHLPEEILEIGIAS